MEDDLVKVHQAPGVFLFGKSSEETITVSVDENGKWVETYSRKDFDPIPVKDD